MKFFHLSDLHIGKKLQGESLLDDQKFLLDQIIEEVRTEHPDGILIAGDVYDKSVPSGEAVMVLDNFLSELVEFEIPIFIISGNHDSPERLQFGKKMFEKKQIYISGIFKGDMETISLKDEFGEVCIYLLPFIKPAMVQPYIETKLESYEQAVAEVLKAQQPKEKIRNILVAHQFVTNEGKDPQRSDSERFQLGGVDSMDVHLFDAFDYVALGHIHRPQKIGRMEVRYAGSPLKYSFSEINHKKAITVVELKEKGNVSIRKLPLHPLREMVELKDKLTDLLSDKYENYRNGYYLSITITDEEKQMDPIGQLKAKFDGILEFQVERTKRQVEDGQALTSDDLDKKTPMDLFKDFYRLQMDEELSTDQEKIMEEALQEMEDEEL